MRHRDGKDTFGCFIVTMNVLMFTVAGRTSTDVFRHEQKYCIPFALLAKNHHMKQHDDDQSAKTDVFYCVNEK